ncbi:DNA/pantothenate metabolism flavoprotein [Gracilaria domingensis]|nr:DNA/pantothenate metabolism flavoprotein [Gracilaria domingensis]
MGDSRSFNVFGTVPISEGFEKAKLESFVHRAKTGNLRIAVVTSGGTSVPLEQRAVRYLNNFSTGTRGARSAENFVRQLHIGQDGNGFERNAYAVVFLYREGSKLPFLRDISPQRIADISQISGSDIKFRDESIAKVLKSRKETQDRIFFITYKTVQEYLFNLFAVAETLRPLGKSVLFFLAAAVSDFYIPYDRLPKHKIQSHAEDLVITLNRVPKCLGLLRQEWAPEAFIASFKLETDSDLLVKKSKAALQLYGVNCVIGNLLQTRYQEVLIFDTAATRVLKRNNANECVEEALVNEIGIMHERYIGHG